MSRNFQPRVSARSTTKASKSYASTTEESSDSDSYGGVNDISDDDGDEPDVEEVEEQHLKDTELDEEATPRPSIDDGASWDGISDDDDQVLGDDGFFTEQLARGATHEMYDDTDPLDAGFTNSEHIIKHVRFEDQSDDSDIQSADSQFPDILDRDSLNPNFLRQIEHDSDDDANSEGSYWDHRGDDELAAAPAQNDHEDEDDEYDSDSSDDMTSYDSDETTDDDLPAVVKASEVQKNPDPADANASSSEEEVVRTHRPMRPRPPRMGRWVHSLSRPFAVIHTDGKKMILFNKQAIRRSSVEGIMRDNSQFSTPRQRIVDSSPMMSNSANIMMSAASSNSFFAAGPEAYFPWTSVDADGTIHQDSVFPDSSSYDGDDLDDGEGDILIEDFLDFGDETTADEKDNDDEEPSTDATVEQSATPAQPHTGEDKNHQLLNHFNNVSVSAFRRDQDRKQLLHRNVESKDSLAFGGNYLEGTLRGVKSGRLRQATVPITPQRKQRKGTKPILPSSPASPLSQVGLSKKRAYEGEQFSGHKRNRSMV